MARIIYNDIIPFKGFQAITLLPFIFARDSFRPLKENTVRHESIHLRQQLEVLIASAAVIAILCLTTDISWWWMAATPLCYFVMYGLEYIVRLFVYGKGKEAYRNISFEQEAFLYERDTEYISRRKAFAWVKYITKITYKR